MLLNKKMVLSFLYLTYCFNSFNFDLAFVGFVNNSDGIGSIVNAMIKCLKEEKLKIKLIKTMPCLLNDVQDDLTKSLINEGSSIFEYTKKEIDAKITLLTDIIWTTPYWDIKTTGLKIAFSMTEINKLHSQAVKRLNTFDAVIVPDTFLVDVYKNSGVKIPIFVFPIPLDLDQFLNKKNPHSSNQFIFGCSGIFSGKKNQKLLRDAFVQEFSKDENVVLWLHSKNKGEFSDDYLKSEMRHEKVKIICQNFSKPEYLNFLASLDCYVLLSKGEGFSIVPRQAIALGIPTILSNVTAHKTLCNTNLVESVQANIHEKQYYDNEYIGDFLNCSMQDAKKAMRNVYNNYKKYLIKANKLRILIKDYNYSSLSKKCLNFVKPKKIVLGKINLITDDCIITNSKELYSKYINLFK